MNDMTDLPYRGLAYYEESNQNLFAGRSAEVKKCSELILRSSTSVFVLHGLSGSGKSSFIRAGLIPHLKDLARNPNAAVGLLVISPQDLDLSMPGSLYPLACSIHDAALTVRSKRAEIASIISMDKEEFARSHANDAPAIYNALASITLSTASLPIFFVDQVEQILYGKPRDAKQTEPFLGLMKDLCSQQVDIRVCVSMRSEYKARFDDEMRGARPFALAGFCLTEMQPEPLREAIERPTEAFGFSFAEKAVDVILAKLGREDGVMGGPLVAAQVMCDRLYRNASERSKRDHMPVIISREDVLALGDPNDQIQFHIQESLYNAFSPNNTTAERPLTHTPRLAARADRWFERLADLVVSSVDGRAHSGSCDLAALLSAETDDRNNAKQIVDHLASSNEYILKFYGSQYSLRHDSIALALRRWKEINITAATRPGKRRLRTLAAAAYGGPDNPLWLERLYPKPAVLKLATIDDAIWDHLLLIFAHQQGFAQRLGIELDIKLPESSGPVQPGDDLYRTFLHSPGAKAAIIPVEIFKVPDSYCHIAITNVFRGYALTGPKVDAIPADAEVRAFDPFCETFVASLLPYISQKPGPSISSVPEDQRSRGDAFYYWLMSGDNRFGIGPAPTRARWKQTGEFKEWDIEKVGKLLPPDVKKKIADLSMHEVCIVSGVTEREWQYRIAALIFYTVQFILSSPAEFVRFLFDYELRMRSGVVPVSRDAIQDTVSASYVYTTFESYINDYLYPISEDYVRETGEVSSGCREQLQTIYSEISSQRAEYDKMLMQVAASAADDVDTMQLLDTAARHYSIYNFYDACKLLQMALQRLSSR